MKDILIQLYSSLIVFYYHLFKLLQCDKAIIFKSKFKGIKFNTTILNQAKLKRTKIQIQGKNNSIILQQCHLEKTHIMIFGQNNQIHINPKVQINQTKIILRGNNCNITIGRSSTFGGAYMVCMGTNNSIVIGNECMFAENIEIWNSDSHPIYDSQGNITNPSSPIHIGNHVWCGKGCKILKGVTIGENAIIGMEALVTKDIAANTLNVGIPAHSVRNNINWDRCFISE